MRNWTFKNTDFASFPVYSGDDLGVSWSDGLLKVKIWAPTAEEVLFRLFASAEEHEPEKIFPLQRSGSGTWEVEVNGNFESLFYTFQVRDEAGWLNECPDIGAKATGVNGLRGMILNPALTHPEHWESDRRCTATHPTDMVIYEVHVRDFSISPDSGILHKGKYPGFTESGTQIPGRAFYRTGPPEGTGNYTHSSFACRRFLYRRRDQIFAAIQLGLRSAQLQYA